MPKHLTDEEKKHIEQLYNRGLNDQEIGLRIGRTYVAVYNWRKAKGLPANDKPCPDSYRKSMKDFTKRPYLHKGDLYRNNPGVINRISVK